MLAATGLQKFYQSGDRRIEVLRAVDLTDAAGESVSIRGESGSGKSTLLNLLAGLDGADALVDAVGVDEALCVALGEGERDVVAVALGEAVGGAVSLPVGAALTVVVGEPEGDVP